MPRRALACALALLLALTAVAAGCGGGDDPAAAGEGERLGERLRERFERVGDDLRAEAERLADRAREILEDLEQAVPEADPNVRPPTARGREQTGEIDAFLTDVIQRVDRYWTQTLTASGRPEPRVNYRWPVPGEVVGTSCGTPADDGAAFYCPADDTIYVGQTFALELLRGIRRGLPGQEAGQGRAVGDFGVAYVVAHEYAHNVQQELNIFAVGGGGLGARPFELQADCMSGLWANSVYREGRLQPGDVEEALSTALAVGDFDVTSEEHHGTPPERRDAWLAGYRTGDPASCRGYVPA